MKNQNSRLHAVRDNLKQLFPNAHRIHAFATVLALSICTQALAGSATLWQIGQTDHNDAEFALAPAGSAGFHDDGFFVIGSSDPKQDWPYVHPGPADGWAGSRGHTFSIVFAVEKGATEGACRLVLDMVDTQDKVPPRLRLEVNGQPFERPLPAGTGAASLRGQPAQGKPCQCTVDFPATLLKSGNNQIDITTVSGSWFVYDSVHLEAPAEAKLGRVGSFTTILSAAASPAILERDGKRFQRVLASVIHAGEPVELPVQLDGAEIQRLQFKTPRQSVDALVPAVDKVRAANLVMAGRNGPLASRTLTLTPGVRQIILVFKTHFDIGYTDMASNVVQRYRNTMIKEALEVVDQNRDLPPDQQFVWTIPGWPMHKILEDWPGQTPEGKQRVQAALKQGRFVVHALPFTTHTELLEAEDLVRGLGYAAGITRGLGLELPRDAKMTDVPEHTWLLPTLLHHAGVDFMAIGCNGMSGAPHVPPLFWWEGPDGSRVLTRYSPSYGTQLAPDADWPYQTWLAVIHTGDNHGPPKPEEVKTLLTRAAREFPGVKVRIGRMSDFYDAIVAEKPDLPVVHGETPDTWIHGPMSDPAGAKLARRTRPLIAVTESLNTQLRAWGASVPDAAAAISAAYEQSLLYGEHTWGGSIGWIQNRLSFGKEFDQDRAQGRFQRIEASWDEHTAYIQNAQRLITPVLDENLRALAQGVKVAGQRLVVYNPLPWKRSGLVVCDSTSSIPAAFKALEGGELSPVETNGTQLLFFARDLPPMGYRTYVPSSPLTPPATRNTQHTNPILESPFFRATLDPVHGGVVSLIDKGSGRELADRAAPVALGQYLYERFDGNQVTQYCRAYLKSGRMHADFFKPGLPPASQYPYQAVWPKNFKLHIEDGPVSLAATMEAAATTNLPAVTTRLILYEAQPCADLEITLHEKPFEPWPEAGWLCLPFLLDQPQFRLGRLGSIVDPARDLIAGANRHIFAINTGLAITDPQGRGVGLCSMDLPLVSLDTPGCWKFSNDFVPRKPTVYVNLFNNQWNTNFRLWNKGTWTTRVRVWAIDHSDADSSLITPSLETRYPLQAVVADGTAGPLPTTGEGLELNRKGILVTAFGANPDGDGMLLRLWEYAGHSGLCQIRLPVGMKVRSAQPVDLRGRPHGQPLQVSNGRFAVDLPSFTPATLLLRD